MTEAPKKPVTPVTPVELTEETPVTPVELTEETLDINDHSVYAQVKNIHGGTLVFEHGNIEFGEIGDATQAELFYQAAFIERV